MKLHCNSVQRISPTTDRALFGADEYRGQNTAGLGIELAIRQWARSDEPAAAAVAGVDAARLKNVGQLYRATGLPAEEADAQAFLFYCFIFGQSLLFLERGPRKRAQLAAKSAEKLIEDHDQARPNG
jgi:hypothetical protein